MAGRAFYCLNEVEREITIHPAWSIYLGVNWVIVRRFVLWEWLAYLQTRNPSTPSLSSKLLHEFERGSLRSVVGQWNDYGLSRCLYTGRKLRPKEVEADHFVPWAFVAHDQPWNLVPSAKEINGQKRDALPDWERHGPRIVEHQFRWLQAARTRLNSSAWRRLIEPWAVDLRVPMDLMESSEELALRAALRDALSETVPNLLALARRQGFPPWQGVLQAA